MAAYFVTVFDEEKRSEHSIGTFYVLLISVVIFDNTYTSTFTHPFFMFLQFFF